MWQPELAAAEKQTDETNTVEQERLSSQGVPVSILPARRRLVVRRIIRRKRLPRRVDFVARRKIAAAPTRSEFVLTFRTGRDDHSAARGRTENQSSIRRDANKPGANRTSGTAPS